MSAVRKRSQRSQATSRNSEHTRVLLLQAAFQEMHGSGFRSADLDAILAKAGVTKGAFYYHFDNKESWRNGYMEDLGTLGGPDSWASAVNERSEVVGWAYINSTPNTNNGVCLPNVPTQDPFLWRNGKMIDLVTFGGTCGYVGSFANSGSGGAINNRGQLIGTSNLAGNQVHHAFLWNEGDLIDPYAGCR